MSVSSRLSESQPVIEIYDACRPCVQQAVPAAVQQLSSAWSDEHGGPFYIHLIPILKYRQISPQTSRVGFHSKKRVQLRPVMSSEYITDTHLQQQRKSNEDPALRICFSLRCLSFSLSMWYILIRLQDYNG